MLFVRNKKARQAINIFILRYQDYVAELLAGDCVVHHAPWAGDGGSLDTRYILQCLPLLLSSSVYEPVQYDVIIFNAGLHDVDCCNFPKEVKRQMKIHLLFPGLSHLRLLENGDDIKCFRQNLYDVSVVIQTKLTFKRITFLGNKLKNCQTKNRISFLK